MDRAAWLAARRELVTASDVAAMLGESPWKTRDQLRMEKAGLADEQAVGEAADIGLHLESSIADLAAKRFGWALRHHGKLLVDRECPCLGATPDYEALTPWGLADVQVKVTSAQPRDAIKPTKSGKPSTAAFAEGPPLHMRLQVQAELAVMGHEHGVLLVLHTQPLALRSYYVPYHAGVVARIRAEARTFWAEVQALKEGKAA